MKTVISVAKTTVRCKLFEPGELVTATSSRSVLETDRVYRVVRCSAPPAECPDQPSIVFVEGRPYGIDTTHVATAEHMIAYYQKYGPTDLAESLRSQLNPHG